MERDRLLTRAEWGICIAATVAAVWLHLSYWFHAGGLWRDEVITARVAACDTAGGMWRMLQYESFPALFPAAVRIWSAIGLGASDTALRGLGFLMGLSLLGAIWLNARILHRSLP